MNAKTTPPSAEEVAAWLESALTRPAREGARIVALHWLRTLEVARHRWIDAIEARDQGGEVMPGGTPPDDVEALHKARVALRRLRATLREHRGSLDLQVDRRTRRALQRLNAVTGAARDGDVHLAWLAAKAESLPESAHGEAKRLRSALHAGAEKRYARVAQAFRRQLDGHLPELERQLSRYTLDVEVGRPVADVPFAAHLASRVQRGVAAIRRDLAHAPDITAQGVLHALRIALKRQRAMLAPFSAAHPDIGVWYATATEGQDQLGAMRDATLLAEVAVDRGCPMVADVLVEEAVAHYEAFRARWIDASANVLSAATSAVQALESLADNDPGADHEVRDVTSTSAEARHGLPMEIERKFLLHGLPPQAAMAPSVLIEQGWLPGTVLRERLRRSVAADGTTTYTRTIKLGQIGARIEVEEPTEPSLFNALWPHTLEARIRKRRHLVREGLHTWEVDVFLDRDLVIAEIELRDTADVVAPPAWLAPFVVREVTHDPAYLNSVMARRDVATPTSGQPLG